MTYILCKSCGKKCDSSRESIYSSKNVSVLIDGTYVYNLGSNETSTVKINLTSSIETSFDADSIVFITS